MLARKMRVDIIECPWFARLLVQLVKQVDMVGLSDGDQVFVYEFSFVSWSVSIAQSPPETGHCTGGKNETCVHIFCS